MVRSTRASLDKPGRSQSSRTLRLQDQPASGGRRNVGSIGFTSCWETSKVWGILRTGADGLRFGVRRARVIPERWMGLALIWVACITRYSCMDASHQCKTNMVMLRIPVRSHCGSSAFVTNIRPEDEEVLSRAVGI